MMRPIHLLLKKRILPVLSLLSLSGLPLWGQQVERIGPTSATLIALERHGIVADQESEEDVIGGARYVKLRKTEDKADGASRVRSLLLQAGLQGEAVTPLVSSDQILASAVGSYRSTLSGHRRAAAIEAEEELSRIISVSYAEPIHPRKAAAILAALPEVEYAEPVIIPRILGPDQPNDPKLPDQKQIKFTRADEAWKIWPGDSSVVIGIIDAGITARHEDLWDNIAPNYGESGKDNQGNDRETNGIDDDGNGYVDDWKGANLTADADGSEPGNTENGEHGTQVAGYAAATTDNDRGIAGIANQCRFFPVKAANRGSGRLAAGYEGIIYCAQRGFQVINCSWGSTTYSQAEQDIIENVTLAYNATVVAAGGNDPEYNLYYPAGYRHVLGVGGVNEVGQFITTWGEHIDITATGGLTTSDRSEYYDLAPATSYTTPVISGIVALVRSRWPELDARQAAAHVRLSTVNIDPINVGKEGMIGTGRADAFAALSDDPFSRPAFVIDSVWAVDENGVRKEQFVVGEKGRLMVAVTNILGGGTNARLQIARYTTDSAAVTFGANPVEIGSLGSGESRTTPEGIPFEIKSSSNGLTRVRIDFRADNYVDYAYEILRIYRPYTVYSNSRIDWTLTDRGRTGFDRLEIGEMGEGVLFRDRSQLFEGGLIVAVDRTHVLDNVRSSASDDQNNDFSVVEVPNPGNDSTLVISDADADESRRVGLELRSRIRFIDSVPEALGVDWYVYNRSGGSIDSLRVGFFGDWDLDGTDAGQSVTLGAEPVPGIARYGLLRRPGGTVIAIGVAEPAPHTLFFAITNNNDPLKITDDFNKDEKWMALANGVGNGSAGPADISLVIGEVLADLADGAVGSVRFIVGMSAGSESEAIDAMRRYADARTSGIAERKGTDNDLRLVVSPNPTSNRVEVLLPESPAPTGLLVLNNVRGERVRDLSGELSTAREGRLLLSLDGLSAGIYYLTWSSGGVRITTPFVVIR